MALFPVVLVSAILPFVLWGKKKTRDNRTDSPSLMTVDVSQFDLSGLRSGFLIKLLLACFLASVFFTVGKLVGSARHRFLVL